MSLTQPSADAVAEADRLVLEIMLTPEGRADPYPRYRALREIAPMYRSAMAPVWFCTRYDDCRTVLRDNRFGKWEPVEGEEVGVEDSPIFGARGRARRVTAEELEGRTMLMLNPPDHTRLRGLVSRGFTPRRVESLRPALEAMTTDILDGIEPGADTEVLDALGFPLPVRVIGELVGVPAADRDRLRGPVRDAANSLEPGTTDADAEAAQQGYGELQEYFRALIAARRDDPQDDLTSALIAARDDAEGDRLSEVEMISTLILIFAAGFETTTNLLGNGIYALLRHPDEWARVVADPGLVPAAVEEVLRWESPVQLDARSALEDADLAGQEITRGETVVTFLGEANRDPDHFEEPERFRIVERDTPVLSFASGIHYCLGASLARMEGQVVFAELARRFPAMSLVDTPEWRGTYLLRGLAALHVRFA